ncbi:hypothetical protein Pyn_35350 [Prunus yedoensis var. nudiflora]|uniref:Serine aminopeptidase S33 domain-containing protein n=1 Tax=Prunus yedoensis var. nudiflora TaxID=2094558 RepID=A0A314XKH8_PRUYE|nr:hypothetical protein Pyn_35350 [Prunus yedoensis var. nudiflora]
MTDSFVPANHFHQPFKSLNTATSHRPASSQLNISLLLLLPWPPPDFVFFPPACPPLSVTNSRRRHHHHPENQSSIRSRFHLEASRRLHRPYSHDLDHSQQPNRRVVREGSSYDDQVSCCREEEVAWSGPGGVGRGRRRARASELDGLLRASQGFRHLQRWRRWTASLVLSLTRRRVPLGQFASASILPGIDGTGLGLIRHQHKLGKIFDVWCLHIPAKDRTSFTDLVKLVERTIRSEHHHSPNRPIYLVGESLGACLALSVAALNPDIDLVLILANPATSFSKSQLQPIIPVLQVIPDSLPISLPHILSSMTGVLAANLEKGLGLPLPQTVEKLSRDLVASTTYLSVLADILPRETLLWKLQMIRSASPYANSRLHAVKAQTLILSSGRDQLLPSQEEGERLKRTLANCEIRTFENSGHFLFSEDDFDLVTVIKGTGFYRHSRHRDYVSDYIHPRVLKSKTWLSMATSPVMLSTLADGKIVRSLAGIPSEGPVLFVGYHMLLGFELAPW